MQFPITSKTLREDAQTAEMELIAVQYRGRARVLQAKLFAQTENCAAVAFSQSNCAIACSLGKALHASFLVLALTYRSLLKLKTVQFFVCKWGFYRGNIRNYINALLYN